MIALDTNLLVRLVAHDDEPQARAVERLLIKARRDQTSLFIADIVLCELVGVLTSRLGLDRDDVADTLDQVLNAELIVTANAGVTARALAAYRKGKGDFADYVIREQALAAEATEVVTFDRSLKGEPGFRMLI